MYLESKDRQVSAHRGHSSPKNEPHQAPRAPTIHPAIAHQRVFASSPDAVRQDDIMLLQRTVGNRAVGRMLQVKTDKHPPLQCQLEPDNDDGDTEIQRQTDACGPRGPAEKEPGNPLIYSYLEARAAGISETLRSKRPAVGYAQRKLNAFLRRFDAEGTALLGADNLYKGLRSSLSPPYLVEDCWFGSETQKATILLQNVFGLVSDGKIGDKTWPVLENADGATLVCPADTEPVQAALTLGSPGDTYEQEADAVSRKVTDFSRTVTPGSAEQALISRASISKVLAMMDAPQQKISTTRSTGAGQARTTEHEDAATDASTVPSELEARIIQSKGTGSPLPPAIQNTMALQTGYNFENVRFKNNAESAELNRRINARAFTHGADIWLGRNESPNNIQLMSHELTHVVQQGTAQRITPETPAGLNGLKSGSLVKNHLRALTAGRFDPALYRKEIAQFQAQNATDQIAALQHQIMESTTRVDIQQKSNPNVLLRRCGCSSEHPTPTPAPSPTPTPTPTPTPAPPAPHQPVIDVSEAITYNRNELGIDAQLMSYIKSLLNTALPATLVGTAIDTDFVNAVARFQEQRHLTINGHIDAATRQELAGDLTRRLHGTTTAANPRALRASENILNIYISERNLFAWWGGDFRDNDKDDSVDSDDRTRPRERNTSDGWPPPTNSYPGFKTIPGTYTSPTGRSLTTVAFETTATVRYKVCADIVSQAYRDAGIMSSTTRSVAAIKNHFRDSRHCDLWRFGDASFPSTYLPGDFICTETGGHGHAGMIVHEDPTGGGSLSPVVVHLPGSSTQIDRGEYDPRRTSDVRLERWPAERWIPDIMYLGRSRR